MKKIVTAMALTIMIFACNNASDSSSTTETPAADTIQTDTPTPPPAVMPDTSALQTDSAKVKKAMRK